MRSVDGQCCVEVGSRFAEGARGFADGVCHFAEGAQEFADGVGHFDEDARGFVDGVGHFAEGAMKFVDVAWHVAAADLTAPVQIHFACQLHYIEVHSGNGA